MLDLHIASKSFKGTPILGDLALRLGPAERVAILGPSGSGKTTLLRIIAGLDRDFEGSRHAPRRTALMFQNPNLLPWRSVAENLRIFHPSAAPESLEAMLDTVGLTGKADHFPAQLSLGQQRRLSLARTLLSPCDMILLDEPFASLDPQLRDEMITLTDRLAAQMGAMIILVTHDIQEAQALKAKPLHFVGTPAQII